MKKIASIFVILGVTLSAMAQSSDMQHRVGASFGVGVGSLLRQVDYRADNVKARWGAQEMFEIDYLFLSQPLDYGENVRLGARAGFGIDLLGGRISADRTFSSYAITDPENRPVKYSTEVTGISEKNTMLSLAIPVQFVLRLENGLFAAAGVRVLCPVYGSYRMTTSTNDITAYYPTLDVHEPNQIVTGQMEQAYSLNGRLHLPKTMCNIDLELGYEWTLADRHFLRLTAYGSFPTANTYTSESGHMLYVYEPRSGGALMSTESLMNAHGARLSNISLGIRLGYSFNLLP